MTEEGLQALAPDAGKALLERLEKAERRYEETTWESEEHMLRSPRAVLVAEIRKYRNMLGRAMVQRYESRAQALEEAAKVAEEYIPVADPGVTDTRLLHGTGVARYIAAAIRALKDAKP